MSISHIEKEFLNNKYTKWYNNIVSNASKDKRKKNDEIYYERHHIIPKCKPFLGHNKKENIVLLTAKEHFICHLLLTKMCEGTKRHKMVWALHRMAFSRPSGKRTITSTQYETARKIFSSNLKENHPSKDPEWRKRASQRVLLDWKDNNERREEVSKIFISSHKHRKENNSEEYYETQRKNSKIGGEKIKERWKNDEEWSIKQRNEMSKRTAGKNNPMYGKKIVGEHREKLSRATSRKRWVHNEKETLYIDVDLLNEYLQKGYNTGRGNYKRKETR